MYPNKLYHETDINEMYNFIEKNGFGILVNASSEFPMATHIPVQLKKKDNKNFALIGHLSKVNLQWKLFEKYSKVLVIFHGAHSYISSSWYKDPNVPTWNYKAVHVYGKIKIVDEDELYKSLSELVKHYETNVENPISVETLPQDMIKKEMKGIVGFEIEIEKIEGVTKLSQNRNSEDYAKIIEKLEKTEDPNSISIADEMKKRIKKSK
jgi:transcriptional regulator